jgi:O-antigen ligase
LAPRVSRAVWLPIAWIFFVASKFPSQWLEVLGIRLGGGVIEEGSPLDALFFGLLIGAGLLVLVKRGVSVPRLVSDNVWLALFLFYCFLAIFWSDFPFVAFKRWYKVLGHPVMALVILTDRVPLLTLQSALKRAAYVMLPLSIVFIKYFPELGRFFDPWTGEGGNSGIHHNKNELGYTCLVFAVFFWWYLVAELRQSRIPRPGKAETASALLMLWMLWWLLSSADSATAIVCSLLGVGTILLIKWRFWSRRFAGAQLVVVLLAAAVLELSVGVYRPAVELLGRNPTLTDRTEVWADVLAVDINPLVGAGFESFWLGERREALWRKWWWRPTQAHNGYIETYLNLGWIGVVLLAGVIVSAFRKGRAELLRDPSYGSLRFAFLIAILTYNYTEAAFQGVHLIWTIFFLVALDYTAVRLPAETEKLAMPAGTGARPWAGYPAAATVKRPEPLAWSPAAADRAPRGGAHGWPWRGRS